MGQEGDLFFWERKVFLLEVCPYFVPRCTSGSVHTAYIPETLFGREGKAFFPKEQRNKILLKHTHARTHTVPGGPFSCGCSGDGLRYTGGGTEGTGVGVAWAEGREGGVWVGFSGSGGGREEVGTGVLLLVEEEEEERDTSENICDGGRGNGIWIHRNERMKTSSMEAWVY